MDPQHKEKLRAANRRRSKRFCRKCGGTMRPLSERETRDLFPEAFTYHQCRVCGLQDAQPRGCKPRKRHPLL